MPENSFGKKLKNIQFLQQAENLKMGIVILGPTHQHGLIKDTILTIYASGKKSTVTEEEMPQYLQVRQKEIWQFLSNLSLEQNIKVLLTKMAIYRQAKIDKPTLELFTAYLLPLDLRAFQVAMATISESERQEGETAFPSLGMILTRMDEARELSPMFSAGATEINTTPLFAEPEKKRLKA